VFQDRQSYKPHTLVNHTKEDPEWERQDAHSDLNNNGAARQSCNQSPRAGDEACQRMKSVNGFFWGKGHPAGRDWNLSSVGEKEV
jgi:hypothetical protein